MSALVVEFAQEAIAQRTGQIPVNEDTPLLGPGSVLDSLGLVTLLVDIEQKVRSEYGASVTIVSDRAMSQKNSPFRSVGALTDYLCLLAAETGHDGAA
jgi:acyl carrier protein